MSVLKSDHMKHSPASLLLGAQTWLSRGCLLMCVSANAAARVNVGSSDSGRSTMRSNSESNQVRASPGDEPKSDALRGIVLLVRVVSAGYYGRAEWTYGLDI